MDSDETYNEFYDEAVDYVETGDEHQHDEKPHTQQIPHKTNFDRLVQLEKGILIALITYLVLVILIKVLKSHTH